MEGKISFLMGTVVNGRQYVMVGMNRVNCPVGLRAGQVIRFQKNEHRQNMFVSVAEPAPAALDRYPPPPPGIMEGDFTRGMDVYISDVHYTIEGVIRDGQYVFRNDRGVFIARSTELSSISSPYAQYIEPTRYDESEHGPIFAVPNPAPPTFDSRYVPIDREVFPEFHMNQPVYVGTQPYIIVGKLDDTNYVVRSTAQGGAGGDVYTYIEDITDEESDIYPYLQPVPPGVPVLPLLPLPNERAPPIVYTELPRDTYTICLKRNEDDNTYLVCSLTGISSVEPLEDYRLLEEGNILKGFVETEHSEDPAMLAKYDKNEIYAVFLRLEGDGPEAVSVFRPFDVRNSSRYVDEVRVTINIDFPPGYVVILEVEEDGHYSLKRIFESKYHTGTPDNTFEPFRFFPYQKLATITRLEPGECILTNGTRVSLLHLAGSVGQKVIIQKKLEQYYFIRRIADGPPPPPVMVRINSGQASNQGSEGSCAYHVITKILIKSVFKKFFYLDLSPEEDARINRCVDLFDTFTPRRFDYREVYARAGRKGAVNIILFQLIYNMFHELRNPNGAFQAPGTQMNLLAVLYHSILAPNFQGPVAPLAPRPVGFMGPIQRCNRFDGLYPDPKVQEVGYEMLKQLRDKVEHEKMKFIQVRVIFTPELNEDERFHATLRDFLSKDLYVAILGLNKNPLPAALPTAPHARHSLLLIGNDHARNYLIKNSWGETAPFSAPLTDIMPPDQQMYNFTTEELHFLIPCPNRVFEVFSTLAPTDPPGRHETDTISPALREQYGFYYATAEEFITTMTAYFPKYDAFSMKLKGKDYQISQFGRRYSVRQGFGNRLIRSAFDELDDLEPERVLTTSEADALALEPERGGKRTRKYRNRTLRKRYRKKYTTKLV